MSFLRYALHVSKNVFIKPFLKIILLFYKINHKTTFVFWFFVENNLFLAFILFGFFNFLWLIAKFLKFLNE